MPILKGKLGDWNLPHFQKWKDRKREISASRTPLIDEKTRIVTIGSCFAEELAAAISRLGLCGAMNPTGRVYDTPSLRQEIERCFGGWPEHELEPCWKVGNGYVHPFKHSDVFPDPQSLKAWSDDLDRQAAELFQAADVVVITVGLIEAWLQPKTGNYYRYLPHPDVFPTLGAKLHRVTVAEMLADLERIRQAITSNTAAQIILTASPVPLQCTVTDEDVRVANSESKCRIRAACGEFAAAHKNVHYFHSYEIITTQEYPGQMLREDGRHVRRRAVDYIMNQFLRQFAREGFHVPRQIPWWLTPPLKTAPRPGRKISNYAHLLKTRLKHFLHPFAA